MTRKAIIPAITTAFVVTAIATVGFLAFRATDDAPTATATATATATDATLDQRNSGGGVDIVASLATPGRLQSMDPARPAMVDPEREIAIVLTLDTHEVDLGAFDYEAGARLLGDGALEEKPIRWIATKDDSHHLEGMLVFTRQPRNQLTLALRGLGGVPERVFNFPARP